MSQKIECPKCGNQISVDEAIIQRAVDLKVKGRLEEEKEKIAAELQKEFQKNQTTLLKQLQEKLNIEEKKRREAEQKELEFIKKQTDLEDKIRRQDLEIARQIQAERRAIVEKAQKESEEKFRFLNDELRKQLEDTKKALQEAQRKAHQGSMQTQGEILELAIEEILKKNFYSDQIEEIKKGAMGADIIQKVIHSSGRIAGIILWETKRTKTWEDKWVEKLKDDGRNIKANACVLVSDNLPKGIKNIDQYLGVIVCNTSSALGVSSIIRKGLLSNFNTVLVNTNKDEKQAAVYDYLCSPAFRQKIEVIHENSKKLLEIQEAEKRWMTKKWTQEEMRIRRLQENALKTIYDIQGIIDLPGIQMTEQLPEIESGVDNKTEEAEKEKNKDQSNLFAQDE